MLVLSLLIGTAAGALLLSHARLARSVSERVARNDVSRVALHILPAELRLLEPRADIRAAGGDSITARWIRSTGVVCAVSGGVMWIRLRGMRLPDISKDSMLIAAAGGDRIADLTGAVATTAGCGAAAAERIYRVPVRDSAPAHGAVVIFETGSYYLAQRALRYRVGGEGRQPLTDELLQDAGSALAIQQDQSAGSARLHLTLELTPGSLQRTARSATLSLPFVNTRPQR